MVAAAQGGLDFHQAHVSKERKFLEAARNESIEDEDVFFCEIDGMDSSKTLLPHSNATGKDVDSEVLVNHHLIAFQITEDRKLPICAL